MKYLENMSVGEIQVLIDKLLKLAHEYCNVAGGRLSSDSLIEANFLYEQVNKKVRNKTTRVILLHKCIKIKLLWQRSIKRHNAQEDKIITYDEETGYPI